MYAPTWGGSFIKAVEKRPIRPPEKPNLQIFCISAEEVESHLGAIRSESPVRDDFA